MNGAIAEPCVRTSKPPSRAIIRMIGTRTNLRRARMNCQSSAKIDNIGYPSKLIFHRTGQGSRRRALDPVAFRGGVDLERQWPVAAKARHKTARGGHQEKQDTQDHRGPHPLKQKRELWPKPGEL